MKQNQPTEFSYSESIREIEDILSSLQNGNADIDTITEKVRRASELIRACRAKLSVAQKEVEEILNQEKE